MKNPTLTKVHADIDAPYLTARALSSRGLALMLTLALVIAGCGGGGGSGSTPTTAGTPTTPAANTKSLSVTVSGSGGIVMSTPNGISCSSGASCSANYTTGTSVTLAATPNSGNTFTGWGGACSGTATCVITMNAATNVTATFAPVIAVTGSPYVLYTDTLSGPIAGGEGGKGAYLSIFGRNFGTSGLGTTTKVYIGGVEVANYRYLGAAKVGAKLGLQQITVQVGNLGTPTLGVALPVKVVVNGTDSNLNNTFTPSSGRILFVSLSGNDTTAVAGDITKPWRYMQNMNATPYAGAYFAMTTGDHIVIRGGNWSDTNGVDTTWMRFAMGSYARNGTASSWIHITAYPGPINGNAIEDVHYTTPSGKSGGIAGPWSAIAGTSGEYISVSNLRMEISGGAARDAAPINFQYTGGHWRVVNNELGPWVAGNSTVLNAAAVSGHGDSMKVLGNHIHHFEGLSDLQNHGIYADTTAQNWEVAYNWMHDMTGGSLVQFNDNEGGAGTYTLPHGGIWPGFVGIRIHHNWLENAAKYGVNFNDQGSVQKGVYEGQIWDNVIIGTGYYPIRINSTQPVQNLWFAFNTIYNCNQSAVMDEGFGSSVLAGLNTTETIHNKFYNNIFAVGPTSSSLPFGSYWLVDYSVHSTTASYDFKRNLYFSNGQTMNDPVLTLGDTSALVANPLFNNAAGADLTTQSGSPARKAATQALPGGFVVTDDFIGFSRTGTFDLGALQAP